MELGGGGARACLWQCRGLARVLVRVPRVVQWGWPGSGARRSGQPSHKLLLVLGSGSCIHGAEGLGPWLGSGQVVRGGSKNPGWPLRGSRGLGRSRDALGDLAGPWDVSGDLAGAGLLEDGWFAMGVLRQLGQSWWGLSGLGGVGWRGCQGSPGGARAPGSHVALGAPGPAVQPRS